MCMRSRLPLSLALCMGGGPGTAVGWAGESSSESGGASSTHANPDGLDEQSTTGRQLDELKAENAALEQAIEAELARREELQKKLEATRSGD